MKTLLLSIISIFMSVVSFASSDEGYYYGGKLNATYSKDKIVCTMHMHPVYNKVIVYGSNEIHFERKDGVKTSAHHDGYDLTNVNGNYYAVYGGDEDLLFFMSRSGFGHVQSTGHEEPLLIVESRLYPISGCVITPAEK